MEIGLITDSLSSRSFDEVLGVAADLDLSSIELPTGNWSEAPHLDLDALLDSEAERLAYLGKIAQAGLRVSALNANGNQLHPVSGPEQDLVLRARRSDWPGS
ncbi:hypothetical protein AAHB37_19060 [Glutamicibacter halophytocola]|uniref:hypothetical protein n=1 Tax=Glutamicibacter halophytocola TaxID=1933880 RepID=UPI00321B2C95